MFDDPLQIERGERENQDHARRVLDAVAQIAKLKTRLYRSIPKIEGVARGETVDSQICFLYAKAHSEHTLKEVLSDKKVELANTYEALFKLMDTFNHDRLMRVLDEIERKKR